MFGRDDFFMYRSMENGNKSKIPEAIALDDRKQLDTDSNNENNYYNELNNYNDEANNWSEEDLEDEIQFNNNNNNNSNVINNTNKQYINDITSATLHNIDNNMNSNINNNNHLITKDGYEYVNVNDLINEIGFGKFHYGLTFLCGLGYIADSMWSSSISLIINPVQNEFNIPNIYIGWLASTLFLGMCIGSFFWGRISDIIGRKFPFALTLCIAGIAGMITAFMTRFLLLLLLLFILGLGVGGNLPVDGAILAEFLPTSHRGSIMVSLSIFWSLGDLLSAIIAYMIVPSNTCSNNNECKLENNLGWRYLIFILGVINCCFLLFRLGTNESPNFLICQGEGGRTRALNVLKTMANVNGVSNKVHDKMILQIDNPSINRQQMLLNNNNNTIVRRTQSLLLDTNIDNENNNYNNNIELINIDLETYNMGICDIFKELFSNKNKSRNLRIATPLIWISWFGSSFGLSMFSLFLPKFLKHKNIKTNSLYADALILAIAALPGPFIGAYFVETKKFGRRYTMTLAASLIAIFMLIFLMIQSEHLLVLFACIISLLETIYFSGLLCYTPEAYPTDIRTTASGIATGIRHVANIIAPLIGGQLFGKDGYILMVMSSLSLLCVAISTYLLPFETRKQRLVPTVRLSL